MGVITTEKSRCDKSNPCLQNARGTLKIFYFSMPKKGLLHNTEIFPEFYNVICSPLKRELLLISGFLHHMKIILKLHNPLAYSARQTGVLQETFRECV